jgi:hypothetical protein
MLRITALLATARVAASAAPMAIKSDFENTVKKTSSHSYIGFCNPEYDSETATIQYYEKWSCDATSTTRTFYKDQLCATAYSGKEEVGPDGKVRDLRVQTFTLPNTGKVLNEVNMKMAEPFEMQFDEDTTYSCVAVPDGLMTEAKTTYKNSPNDGACTTEPSNICNFARSTVGECVGTEMKISGIKTSYKIDGEYIYTWQGNTICEDDWATRTERQVDECPIIVGTSQCANYNSDEIEGGRVGYAGIVTGQYLNDDGEVEQSAASSGYGGMAPFAMMAAAQLFVGDSPVVRALAVATMVAMHVAPATAETEMVHKREMTGLAAGMADKLYVPNKRCIANFRKPSETEEKNEMKFGVVEYYSQSFCKGEDLIVTERFAAGDTTCEGDVAQTDEMDTSVTTARQVGTSKTKCYFASTDGTCGTAASDANKATCAGMVTAAGAAVTADNCAATGCYTYVSTSYSPSWECPSSTGTCQTGDTRETCTATMATQTDTCVEAPAGLGTLIVRSYSDAACTNTKQCGEVDHTTGYCQAYGKNSLMYTASATTASYAYYTKTDGSALECTVANKVDFGTEMAATPVGQCLSNKDYPDTKSSFQGACESERGAEETWFKLEYVAGEGEAESSAAGLTLLSVASMATGVALITQLIM